MSRTFDFTCDARISVTIVAEDEVTAREVWRRFCHAIEEDDYLAAGGHGYYVHLAQEEPEVTEEVPV